jgi:hypothetical protein
MYYHREKNGFTEQSISNEYRYFNKMHKSYIKNDSRKIETESKKNNVEINIRDKIDELFEKKFNSGKSHIKW